MNIKPRTSILFLAALAYTALSGSALGQGVQTQITGELTAPQGSGDKCVITGDAQVENGAIIFNAAKDGTPLAKFTTAKVPLIATSFPPDSSTGRALINTSGGFQVEGFVGPRAVKAFGKRDIQVSEQLFISPSAPVTIVGSSPGRLRVELAPADGLTQPIGAWVPCDAITFNQGQTPRYEVPRGARGYVSKQATLELFNEPKGVVSNTLNIANNGNALLLWGDPVPRQGYVHVTARTNSIYIDAWVNSADVRVLPKGEIIDTPPTPAVTVASPPALANAAQTMRAPKAATVFAGLGQTNTVMGRLAPDTEIYIIQTVAGWSSVLPKDLFVFPNGNGEFRVKSEDLGLAPPPPPPPAPTPTATTKPNQPKPAPKPAPKPTAPAKKK